MNKKKKRNIAGFVAACMVSTILSPALPVYAMNYGDSSEIIFDTGDGPATNFANDTLVGYAGHPLSQYYSTLPQDNTESGYPRPALPVPSAAWPGYSLDGWYTGPGGTGTKLNKLPYAFPYVASTTYYANWIGDGTDYLYSVKHEAEINGGITVKFADGLGSQQVTAGETITASPLRDIPGYQVTSGTVAPQYHEKYGGTPTSTLVGSFNSSNQGFTGKMENSAVTVSYKYVVDSNKKFTSKVEYIDNSSSGELRTASTTSLAAESPLNVSPAAITGYTLVGASVTAGTETAPYDDTDKLYGVEQAGGSFDAGYTFSGYMPNQPVTIQYRYDRDPLYQSALYLNYVDSDGNILHDSEVHSLVPGTAQAIQIPVVSGYEYDFNITVSSTGTLQVTKNVDESTSTHELVVTSDVNGGTIDIVYVEDLNDADNWARVTYSSGNHGSISGNSTPRIVRTGLYDLTDPGNDVTAGIDPDNPDAHYVFDGWYKVGSDGNPTGNAISTLNLNANMALVACYEENPGEWFDIIFTAGSHGSFAGQSSHHVSQGTMFNSIAPTSISAVSGYQFAGWYDSVGNPVTGNPSISSDMTYTARFELISPDPGYQQLNRPDADGSVGNDGRGEISISNAVTDRIYAVTDMSGNILATLSGQQIINGYVFDDLDPGTTYYVYEIDAAAVSTVGASVDSIPGNLKSSSSLVAVPAVGDNVVVSGDSSNAGQTQIIISPAASGTEYALLDEDGNVVYDWEAAAGSPLEVVFDNLDPNTTYTVVTRPAGSTATAEGQGDYGTNVFTDYNGTTVTRYMIEIIDGEIVSAGADTVNDTIYQGVSGGDSVRITADAVDSLGESFKEWNLLIGDAGGFPTGWKTRRNLTFTMPETNIVMVAVYAQTISATPANAAVDYKVNSGHEGEVALDMTAAKIDDLRSTITQTEDQNQMSSGREVAYRIQFTKRNALATESNALEAEVAYEDAFKAAWALDVDLFRYIDGDRRPVLDGTVAGYFDVLAQIDTKDMGYLDYQLWEIDEDGIISEIVLTPDPETASEYAGLFRFSATVDATYILTYSRAYTVTLKDLTAGSVTEIILRRGESLDSSSDYQSWIPTAYSDNSGTVWSYKGLSSRENSYREYDVTAAVTKNMTLYAFYDSDDPDWKAAWQELSDEIQTANNLMNNGNLSQEDKDTLQAAIDAAEAIINAYPRPTTQELIDAYAELKAIVDAIRNGGTAPEDSGTNSGGSGGSGGGGGSSSTTSSSSRRSVTYRIGVDGDWQMLDEEENMWIFVLNSGSRVSSTWAYLTYTNDGVTTGYYYHFGDNGVMDYGWYLDSDGHWYYLSEDHDGWYGHMKTGWHFEEMDQQYYYLHDTGGYMITGWKQVDGKWYYFSPLMIDHTWTYNEQQLHWEYNGSTARPYGSMYVGEMSPDGYRLDDNGAWQ